METDLYNHNGKAVMYVADSDDRAIYTWSGHAVAYLADEMIYGWRGKHIGWFIGGIVYDLHGSPVGYTREKCPIGTYVPYVKYAKYVKYVKYVRYLPAARPGLLYTDAHIDLEAFLSQNKI